LVDNNAIELQNIKKSFKIFHERKDTLYEHMVTFFDRKKSYDELTVLNDITLSVKKGEMLGVLGLNGSGKTTLLQIMGNIMQPDEGIVKTLGSITPFLDLGTGFNENLTAKDNIITYGIILGMTKNQIKQKIKQIIEFAELEKFLDTKLKNFSSGMSARLAFSTAIQVNPNILLVDEVLSVGDISFQEKSFKAFIEFKNKGKAIVFVTHAVDQIEKLCDKALWLHEGKMRMYGNPTNVVEEYKKFAKTLN